MADIDAFVRAEAGSLLANDHRGVRAAAYTFEELVRPEVVAALRAWRG